MLGNGSSLALGDSGLLSAVMSDNVLQKSWLRLSATMIAVSSDIRHCAAEMLAALFCNSGCCHGLGLLLRTEAPVLTPTGVDFYFVSFLTCQQ